MLKIFHYLTLPSTIDLAKTLQPYQGVIADMQTQGVGKPGRNWESYKGNLHCSINLKPNDIPFNQAHLCQALPSLSQLPFADIAFVFGSKIMKAVEKLLAKKLVSKANSHLEDCLPQTLLGEQFPSRQRPFNYPNDVYLGAKKLAGVLAYSFEDKIMVSFGVNLAFSSEKFANLKDLGIDVSSVEFLRLMLGKDYGEMEIVKVN